MRFTAVALIAIFFTMFGNAMAESYRQVGPVEDKSYLGVKRISVRVIVPDGLSRQQLRRDLGALAIKYAEEHKADAVSVFAYRSQDKDIATSAWTVGDAVYAPNGRWRDAGENAPMKLSVKLGELYFRAKPANIPKAGDEVKLWSASNEPIKLSKSRDVWTEEVIITEIPAGTSALVLERYEKALNSEYLFVRYGIRVVHQGRTIQGWVFEDDIQKPQPAD